MKYTHCREMSQQIQNKMKILTLTNVQILPWITQTDTKRIRRKKKNREKKTRSHYFMPMLPCDKGVSIDIIYVIIAYSISLYSFNFVLIVIKMCIMNYILLLYSEVFCCSIWLKYRKRWKFHWKE